MANKKGKQKQTRQQRPGSKDLARLVSLLSKTKINNNPRPRKKTVGVPHLPLLTGDDIRRVARAGDIAVVRNALLSAFNLGGGNLTLLDEGRVAFQVQLYLPPAVFKRLERESASSTEQE